MRGHFLTVCTWYVNCMAGIHDKSTIQGVAVRIIAGIFSLSLAFVGPAQALTLGAIDLRSALNQPFVADIALQDIRPGEADSLSVRLASERAFQRAGIERPALLDNLRFTLGVLPNGLNVIQVRSSTPIQDPFLNFLVEVDWPQGSVVREYTVLLDPPVFMPERAGTQSDALTGVTRLADNTDRRLIGRNPSSSASLNATSSFSNQPIASTAARSTSASTSAAAASTGQVAVGSSSGRSGRTLSPAGHSSRRSALDSCICPMA